MSKDRFNMYVMDKNNEVKEIKEVKSVEVEVDESGNEYFEKFMPGGDVKAIRFKEKKEVD